LHWYARGEPIVREIGRFVDGLRDEQSSFDRVLATVLFTDIVDSTARAASLGDRGWREVREERDRTVRAQLARFRGREVKTMGDGFLATFDGPARAVRSAVPLVAAVASLGIEIRRNGRCVRSARVADREGPGHRLRSHVRRRR
jgi:class 3 adenylate cyclase